jgi:hypothetical protein
MQKFEIPSLHLCVQSSCLANFFYLLQRGFGLKIRVGMSVETTLTEEIGLDSDLLDKIQTVFLDGKAVDDLESTLVRDGSILALSAAMPGLVGATLRRGSYYAAMRSQITAAGTQATAVPKEGMLTLKVFNLLIRELAPILLGKGIWIEKAVLQDFLAAQPDSFWACCKNARIDGANVRPNEIAKWPWPEVDKRICLEVKAGNPETPDCGKRRASQKAHSPRSKL